MYRDRESAGAHDGNASCVADSARLGDRGAVSVPGEERGVFEYVDGVECDGGDSVLVFHAESEWVVAGGFELVEV